MIGYFGIFIPARTTSFDRFGQMTARSLPLIGKFLVNAISRQRLKQKVHGIDKLPDPSFTFLIMTVGFAIDQVLHKTDIGIEPF